MGLWSWLRGSPDAGGRPQPAEPVSPVDRAAAAAPAADPGWRALPPVQRVLADGAPSVARLADFDKSLATWQSPGVLTALEHGRGPSAPPGSVAGIVDAVA